MREVHLVVQGRIDVDRGIGVERRMRIAGHVCDKYFADAPLARDPAPVATTSFDGNA
jgi:hypothetical protein